MHNLNYDAPSPADLALEDLWEEHMVITGRDQRLAADRKQTERGSAGATKGGRFIITAMIEPLSNMIREEIDRLAEGRVKRKPPELASLLLLPPPALAMIALRTVIDYIGEYGEEAATVPKVGQRIGRMACSEFIARVLKKEERPLFESRVKQIAERTA
jgi:DNA-directed RNA polymerase